MNDWLYRNSLAEYEQRLRELENERLARKLSAQQPRRQVLRALAASLGHQLVVLGQHLQHNSEASVQLQPKS